MVPLRVTGCIGSPLARWSRWDPFGELDRMTDSVFGSILGGREGLDVRVDVREDEGNYYVDADVPGFDRGDIVATFEDGVLTISGERKEEQTRKGENYLVSERRSGRFSRSLRIPKGVKESEIEASLNDGVLTVRLPKADEVKQRRIEVKG